MCIFQLKNLEVKIMRKNLLYLLFFILYEESICNHIDKIPLEYHLMLKWHVYAYYFYYTYIFVIDNITHHDSIIIITITLRVFSTEQRLSLLTFSCCLHSALKSLTEVVMPCHNAWYYYFTKTFTHANIHT